MRKNVNLRLRTVAAALAFAAMPALSSIYGKDAHAAPAPVRERNKALVRDSFDRWKDGTGSPFQLLAAEASWTIVGSSPMSKTYPNKDAFMTEVIAPFNARMRERLIPVVRGIYADGDTVIILFDAAGVAKDGVPYRNTYTWYLRMQNGKAVSAIAFFDTKPFDELWTRVRPG